MVAAPLLHHPILLVGREHFGALQACLERALQAGQYYRDAFPVHDTLYYGVSYELRPDKLETYTVEAVNAD